MLKILKFFACWFVMIGEVIVLPIALVMCIPGTVKRNTHNVVICEHIGDMLFTLGYLNAYHDTIPNRKIRIISTIKWEDLIKLYPESYDSIKIVNRKRIQLYMFIAKFSLGQVFCKKIINTTVVDPGNNFVGGYEFAKRFPTANLKDCIKYGILGLDEEAVYQQPLIQVNKPNNTKKTMLLCPYATVTNEVDEKLYEYIVKEYSQRDYQVYTNVFGSQKVINGTTGLRCSLNELLMKGNSFSCIVGLRSGALDLLSFCDVPIVAIYPSNDNMMSFFDLTKTNAKNKKIKQYKLTSDIEKDNYELCNIISDFVK